MSEWQIAALTIYCLIGFGAALGVEPRSVFKHPFERFVIRVSAGFMWPMYCGYLLMYKMPKENDYQRRG